VGFEADFQGALERDTRNFGPSVVDFPFNGNGGCGLGIGTTSCTATGSYTTQIDWFGTVRARIGYVWGNGNVMSYLTGGLAYGEVKINGTSTVSGPATSRGCLCDFFLSQTQTFGHSQINTGWVVGYGTEGVIDFWGARNWTWKVEGLWMDLGTLDTTSVTSSVTTAGAVGGSPAPGFITGGQVTTHSHFTDGILRAGLNYKFY
jgi:outer membrane immunogenic protein